jgi:hypothetical protein
MKAVGTFERSRISRKELGKREALGLHSGFGFGFGFDLGLGLGQAQD